MGKRRWKGRRGRKGKGKERAGGKEGEEAEGGREGYPPPNENPGYGPARYRANEKLGACLPH